MELLTTAMLSVALLIATITDIRSQRIPNWLTFPLILSGMAAHIMFGGIDGLKLACGGFTVGFIAMVVPYFLGVMGAGDVKLMAGVGTWLGAISTLTAFLFTCIAGGVYALAVLLINRQYLKAILTNVGNAFSVFVATRRFNFTPIATAQPLPRLCYGIAIAVGTIAAAGFHFSQTGSIFGG